MVDLDERYVHSTDREVVLTGVSVRSPASNGAKEGSVREARHRGRNISLADYLVTITTTEPLPALLHPGPLPAGFELHQRLASVDTSADLAN